jgi:hypothetical protein
MYFERVSVVLGNQHSKDMRPITLPSVVYIPVSYIPILPHKRHNFRKKVY